MTGLIGANALLADLRDRPRPIIKTHTRKGVVYHDDRLKPYPTDVIERLIAKGWLTQREPSGQTWELASR